MEVKVSDSFGYWFAGFCDGESYFSAKLKDEGQIMTSFGINLRYDELDVIELIRKTLGVGHANRTGEMACRGKSKPVVQFAISNLQEQFDILIPLFDKYPLLTRKRNVYSIWRTIVLLRMRARIRLDVPGHRRGRPGKPSALRSTPEWPEILTLIDKLSAVRLYQEPVNFVI